MTEKPFRDEDVAVRGKDFCLTQEASGFRLWVRRQNVWYRDYRVTAWVVELVRQLQASQERCKEIDDRLANTLAVLGIAAESMRLMHAPRTPEYPKHEDHVDGCPICEQIKVMNELTMPAEEFAKLCGVITPTPNQQEKPCNCSPKYVCPKCAKQKKVGGE
jgi:hypothetical protein